MLVVLFTTKVLPIFELTVAVPAAADPPPPLNVNVGALVYPEPACVIFIAVRAPLVIVAVALAALPT